MADDVRFSNAGSANLRVATDSLISLRRSSRLRVSYFFFSSFFRVRTRNAHVVYPCDNLRRTGSIRIFSVFLFFETTKKKHNIYLNAARVITHTHTCAYDTCPAVIFLTKKKTYALTWSRRPSSRSRFAVSIIRINGFLIGYIIIIIRTRAGRPVNAFANFGNEKTCISSNSILNSDYYFCFFVFYTKRHEWILNRCTRETPIVIGAPVLYLAGVVFVAQLVPSARVNYIIRLPSEVRV